MTISRGRQTLVDKILHRTLFSVEENIVSSYTSPSTGFELTTLVLIGTDCIGSCKSNYHTITTLTGSKTYIFQGRIQNFKLGGRT